MNSGWGRAVVAIPVYRPELGELDRLSLDQVRTRMGGRRVVLVTPAGLDTSAAQRVAGGCEVITVDPSWFRSRAAYSALMVDRDFYRRFDSEYLLIHQLDAFVFYDRLDEWCARGYEYVGAPWWGGFDASLGHGLTGVGNGGFSLRNVDACARVCGRRANRVRDGRIAEDVFFGTNLRTPTVSEASSFGFEMGLDLLADTYADTVPFGCHAEWNVELVRLLRAGNEPTSAYETVMRSLLERSGNL